MTTTDAIDIDFSSDSQLENWQGSMDGGCSMAVQEGALRFQQSGGAGKCRRFADLGLGLVGGSLAIRVADAGAASLSFSLVLDDNPDQFDERTWAYFEKDGERLYLGTCRLTAEGYSCTAQVEGYFQPGQHTEWRFRHDDVSEALFFETRGEDDNFSVIHTLPGVPANLVDCAGVDLGSYQVAGGPSGSSAFDDLRTE